MNLKRIITKFFPSYRTKDALLCEIDYLKQQLDGANYKLRNIQSKNDYLFWLEQNKSGETLSETKKRVFMNMPKAEGSVRNIQLADFEILKRLKKICDENNLRFYLMYGTLIGAVRHQGFIPWDDDIDVLMLRSDCDKLFEILKDNNELEIHNYYMLYKTGMKFIKVKFKASDEFFVDIFPLEFVDISSDNLNGKYREINKYINDYRNKIEAYGLKKRILKKGMHKPVISEELDRFAFECKANMEKNLPYYGKGNYVCFAIDMFWDSHSFRNFFHSIDELSLYNPKKLVFEGYEFDVFADYDEWLKNEYEDIWELPSCILPHHLSEIEIADFEKVKKYICDTQ